jgi:SAM-dependent methyltransferase
MACPVCGGALGGAVAYPGAAGWRAAGFATAQIAFCASCGLGLADPLPSQSALDAFYSGGGYWHDLADGTTLAAHAQNQCRHRANRTRLALRKRLPGRVLDVGAGEAWLGDVLRAESYEFVEPDPRARERAAKRLGQRAKAFASLDEVGGGYELVFVNQVLEHVADPVAFLSGMAARLTVGGVLYLEVPNADYRFKADVFPHTLFFTADSLARVATRAGLHSLACESFGALPEHRPVAARLAGKAALRMGALLHAAPLTHAGDDLLFDYRERPDGIWLRWLGQRA